MSGLSNFKMSSYAYAHAELRGPQPMLIPMSDRDINRFKVTETLIVLKCCKMFVNAAFVKLMQPTYST
ncbi:hypothetical protein VAEU17_270044 [Vibrio aestuarianus]|nr:hypothetical protein VAEU17_270044 [Vibrio aestuarianus]